MSKARVTKEIRESGIKLVRVKTPGQVVGKIGIHLLRPTQGELENAIEKAERDLFPAIYIHDFKTWGYQNSKPAKQFRREAIQDWLNKLNKTGHGQSQLSRLAERGIDLDKVLSGMTAEQLAIALCFLSAGYGLGHHDSREFRKSMERWEAGSAEMKGE